MQQFDEVYVVSDLHLGGEAGRQIFSGAQLLKDLLLYVANRPADRRVAFVINGDFIDFLAEPGARCFDAHGAADKLLRISRDPGFSPVWEGLRALVSTANRQLILVLGNHDLELALPRVQAAFTSSISDPESEARGRITFSVAGAGFAALVGNARVLCLHGNEVDPFNVTDFERLRRAARDHEFGRTVAEFTPNAGTKLVIDVMNGIKRDYPFIDLLKPETDAVVPVLFAFDQVNVDRVLAAMEVALQLGWDATRKATGFLSQEQAELNADAAAQPASSPQQREELSTQSRAAASLIALLANTFEVRPTTGEQQALMDLLDETELRFNKSIDPMQLSTGNLEDRLGAWNLTKAAVKAGWAKLIGRTPSETMRTALQHVAHDRSFDPSFEDEDFKRIDQIVPFGIEFVIAGHTHLRRSHARQGGQYINTGTWARLINLRTKLLKDPDAFGEFYDALRESSMERLDAARVGTEQEPVVTHQPSVARIERREHGVVGALLEVQRKDGKLLLASVQPGRAPSEQTS